MGKMKQRIKIDLHTHPFEALLKQTEIRGVRDITRDAVERIIRSVQDSGLDGIAITEHNNFNWGWVASLTAADSFADRNILVLPGAELEFGGQHFLRIYVPESVRRRFLFFQGKEWFTVLAHPGFYRAVEKTLIEGIPFDCVEESSVKGQFAAAGEIAQQRGIPLIRTSDARDLRDLGPWFMELEALPGKNRR